jgi:hypothetical protein
MHEVHGAGKSEPVSSLFAAVFLRVVVYPKSSSLSLPACITSASFAWC